MLVSRTAGKVARQRRMRRTERRQIAIRRRQHDDIGGVLPEIAGDVAVVNTAGGYRASDACG